MGTRRQINACYEPGAIWKTRLPAKGTKEKETSRQSLQQAKQSYQENKLSSTFLRTVSKRIVPKGTNVLLLAYFIDYSFNEHVKVLTEDDVLIFFDIDVGMLFDIDPDGINTKRKDV